MSAQSMQPGPLVTPTATGSAAAAGTGLARRLGADRSGTIAMMFALLIVPLAAALGLAIDLGRVYSVVTHTQAALDSAALAAARVGQLEKADTINKASAAATAYFNQAKPTDVLSTTLAFAPNSQQTEFKVTATSWIKTPFLSVLNFVGHKDPDPAAPPGCQGNPYACLKVATTATAQICLSCSGSGGGNNSDGTSLEIAMMLDLTGSMCDPCTKIADLKVAAKDLIDIVVWDDQSKYTSKVALAPFAPAVNVGSDYFTKITGKSDQEDNDGSSSKNIHYPASCIKSDGSVKSSCKNDSGYNDPQYIAKYAKCVVERTGTEQYTDAAPASSSTYLPTWNVATDSMATSCTPTGKILPLTTDRTLLKNTIDAFATGGTTAGQLGTAFAWYLLSPNWSAVWPSASKPASYGTAKLQKIAILMTDGAYNTLQGTQYGDSSSQATTAQNKAVSLCTGMKAKGITVYTVGFQLDLNSAKTMLKNCASGTDKFYDAANGDQLKAAFRDIALKISTLKLTN